MLQAELGINRCHKRSGRAFRAVATNIAAISYVSKRVDKPRLIFTAGLIYTLGQMVSYALAALFFGSLIPMALHHGSPLLLPSCYGIGTAVPVLVFSFMLAFSASRISRAFNALTQLELWMRRLTAIVFMLVGGCTGAALARSRMSHSSNCPQTSETANMPILLEICLNLHIWCNIP